MHEEDVAPSVNLLGSMRSVGYSFEAALADLIDNSITAHARYVDIDADVVNGEFVAILDDGRGMPRPIAREALRLAGTTSERDGDDLGRFGLGLKTASLSQARSVTVATRAGGETTTLRWDIDHVLQTGRWSLLVLDDYEASRLPLWNEFDQQNTGTLVVWQNLDLLLGDSAEYGEYLRTKLVHASEALSLVFHRFLHGGANGLSIRINGVAIKPLDPFLETNIRTQVSPTEEVCIKEQTVEVTAYTLPHPSGLTPAERKRNDLTTGMRDAQGFYVYRNRRLISHGSWYGLAAKNELTKQTRIRVDIPNTLDDLWQLDIRKSQAQPPASFKTHLRRIIDPLLERGRRVHTYRGRRANDTQLTRVWNKEVSRDGTVFYTINAEHPLLQLMRLNLPATKANLLDSVLELLALSFPMHDLYVTMSTSNAVSENSIAQNKLLDKIRLLRDAGVLVSNSNEASVQLASIEPFNHVDNLFELVQSVLEEGQNGTVQRPE